jgi:tetratricopeptide (TPR) repeat protein
MKFGLRMVFYTGVLALIIFSFTSVYAQQNLTFPDLSQKASVTQTIGLTQITINYHRPLVKGRVIWGGLVPYNQVWRAGADENTTIRFSDPVKINGNDLPAGKYGLHIIPTVNEWTIIFSKDNSAWGSYFYDSTHDALRIQVNPESASFNEALTYSFDNPGPSSVTVSLNWENFRVPFKIDADINKVQLEHMAVELTGRAGFNPAAYLQAANYCLDNNYELDQALIWVDKSISMNKGFGNMYTKAQILEKTGKPDEAKKLESEAMQIATENDLNSLGNRLVTNREYDKAIEIFNTNLKSYPKSVPAFMGLANAYSKSNKKDLAIKNYQAAKDLAQDQSTKDRIQKTIDALSNN